MKVYQVVAVCQWEEREIDLGLFLSYDGAEERKRAEGIDSDDWKVEIREREVK